MEKRREQGGVLGSVAELFDLPADVVAGLPRPGAGGEPGSCIWRATPDFCATATPALTPTPGFGVLRVSGQRLTLLAMTGEELRIGGLIDRVEWVTGC